MLKELKVKNVIIGKQFQNSDNLEKLYEIVKRKNIRLHIAELGEKIHIERNLYFIVLWPNNKQNITEKAMNNNSLVCKLNYNTFSMLFTGDIEQIAEEKIISLYKENNKLNSKVIKVSHHGAKTSSTYNFMSLVKPEIALIGVGKNNKFGHPARQVLTRLEELRNICCKN